MKKKILLKISNYDDFQFDDYESILYIGEWCKKTENTEIDEHISVCKYPWDDRDLFYQDYIYFNQIYEEFLILLANKLNEIHAKTFTVQYWRIIVGPWLSLFLQLGIEFWRVVEAANKKYKNLETPEGLYNKESIIAYDMNGFINLYTYNDLWSYNLYLNVIKNFPSISRKKIGFIDNGYSSATPEIQYPLKRILIKNIKLAYNFLINGRIKKSKYFFHSTYLPIFKEWFLYISLKQLPFFSVSMNSVNEAVDLRCRKWNLEADYGSELKKFLIRMIPEQIPVAYLEGYSENFNKALKYDWPTNPKILFTSNAFYSDEQFKFYSAWHIENGAKLVIGQHGGHYGIARWSSIQNHELKIATRYLSWGWRHRVEDKVIPYGVISKKILHIDRINPDRIVIVVNVVPNHVFAMMSSTVSSQWLLYLEEQFEFVRCLNGGIQKKLFIKLYSHDCNWNQHSRWLDIFPNLNYIFSSKDFLKTLKKTKIYVATYNATTFLESLSQNIPTVIFWNPKYWELDIDAEPYFKKFIEVGVFHTNPQSAALHINKIWEKVDEWWNSKPVVEAVELFKLNYCNNKTNKMGRLKEIISENNFC